VFCFERGWCSQSLRVCGEEGAEVKQAFLLRVDTAPLNNAIVCSRESHAHVQLSVNALCPSSTRSAMRCGGQIGDPYDNIIANPATSAQHTQSNPRVAAHTIIPSDLYAKLMTATAENTLSTLLSDVHVKAMCMISDFVHQSCPLFDECVQCKI
jgi:hypothetical protein